MVSVMNGIWMDGENNEYEYNMIDDSSVPRVDWFTLLFLSRFCRCRFSAVGEV